MSGERQKVLEFNIWECPECLNHAETTASTFDHKMSCTYMKTVLNNVVRVYATVFHDDL